MSKQNNILFVLENDYYPRDMRVFNECISLSRANACYIVAPRQKGQKFVETIQSVKCYRYPFFEADHITGIFLEYAVAAAWIALLVPLVSLIYGIKVIHVANPPDFIIPIVFWLRLFGVKIVYDVHDLSVETFKGKNASKRSLGKALVPLLELLEYLSIRLADSIITTNLSIRDHVRQKTRSKPICVVRNSNPILFQDIVEIAKPEPNGTITVGYFGVLADDEAAGLDNIFVVADALLRKQVPFHFSIVGDGPGLNVLRQKVKDRGLEEKFDFHGFIPMPQALALIKNFDFGLVTWGYLPKNHLHTAMKIMDYMCCAVPVCSLPLKEQLNSTQNLGIHAATFEEIAKQLVDVYGRPRDYEALRRQMLEHFNTVLSWELQEQQLINAYDLLTKQ